MKTKTIFIKHEITDKKSLPKNKGLYILIWKKGKRADLFLFTPNDLNDIEWWLYYGVYWLEEREIPSDKEIINWAIKDTSGIKSGNRGLIKDAKITGINWFKSKLS